MSRVKGQGLRVRANTGFYPGGGGEKILTKILFAPLPNQTHASVYSKGLVVDPKLNGGGGVVVGGSNTPLPHSLFTALILDYLV